MDMKSLLGGNNTGIFTTDGHKWHDSRQLIRPQFIKDRVSDLEVFERHTSILLSLMGGQGQVVDAKDLFFRYVFSGLIPSHHPSSYVKKCEDMEFEGPTDLFLFQIDS